MNGNTKGKLIKGYGVVPVWATNISFCIDRDTGQHFPNVPPSEYVEFDADKFYFLIVDDSDPQWATILVGEKTYFTRWAYLRP